MTPSALAGPSPTECLQPSRAPTFGEIEGCRALAERCVFVIGFARSNTTITLEILNTAANALLLGEANFHVPRNAGRFRDMYNRQHVEFGNQPTKSSYAPDFVPGGDHAWWQWLGAASEHFQCLGDKMAVSSHFLAGDGAERMQAFFEGRFFAAKYVFVLRNPRDTLLSVRKLFRFDEPALLSECAAWLRFVQLWADWIRAFPNTLTLFAEDFGPATVAELAAFTGLRLDGAERLLDARNQRKHQWPDDCPNLSNLQDELRDVFELVRSAARGEKVLWQAEQKRSRARNDSRGDSPGEIAVVPRPVGEAWVRAAELRTRLAAPPPAGGGG